MFVFIVSSLIHMATPWHKGEHPKLPKEDAFRDAVGPPPSRPATHGAARLEHGRDGRTGVVDKLTKGPVAIITVLPNGKMSMTGSLVGSFVTRSSSRCSPLTSPAARCRSSATTSRCSLRRAPAFAGYALALWQMRIW